MGDAEKFLMDARRSFRLVAEVVDLKEIERFSAIGRNYLQRAHDAAQIVEPDKSPSLWRAP